MILFIFILLFDGPPKVSGARLLDTSVSCDQDNFILALNFDSIFRGIVYSEEGYPNCVYVNGSMLSQKAYTLKIPLQENRHTTIETISATLPPNALMPTANVNYQVEIRAGHGIDSLPLSAPLNIGDPISYIVKLQKPVADSQIGRCWASDSKSHLELSNDKGCTVQPKGRIWTNFEKRENDREVIFVNKIKAWAFPSSNEVNIYCNLRICMSKNCNFGNCSESSETRFRRDSGGFENSIKRLRKNYGDFGDHGRRLERDTGGSQNIVRSRRNFENSVSDLAEIKTLTMKLRIRRDDSHSSFPNSPVEIADSESTVCMSLVHFGLLFGIVFAFLIFVSILAFFFLPSKIRKVSS
ncbi:hypothetical protein FO519_008749 [Halicephalobus sp. NKZ332]|nr:hypothetical protein FO519_008749 [Halicephalobus sp. NKZ332]